MIIRETEPAGRVGSVFHHLYIQGFKISVAMRAG